MDGKIPIQSWQRIQGRTRHNMQINLLDARRGIFSMSQPSLRVQHQVQNGQTVNVQRVKFQKPGIRLRGVLTSIFTFYVCYTFYCHFVLDPLERAATEALKNMPDDDDEEEDEKPLFIPFPGTTKMIEPVPYRGSDPEWQEFIKFSRDTALSKRIRDELAQYVRQLADRHPVLKMRCGKGMKLRRYWLDVDFPTIPPPEYERSGIEIADDYIAWTTMPVDSLIVHKIRHAFWPTALVKSTWSFTKTLFVDDTRRFAKLLGFQTSTPPSFDQIVAQQQRMMKKPLPTRDGPARETPALTDPRKAITGTNALEKSDMMTGEANASNKEAKLGEYIYAHFFRSIMAFKGTLSRTWKPAPNYPPRGSILVGGLVELDSPKAWLVFDVRAAWDPKTKSYDPRSLYISLRRLQPKKQGPLGGP